VFVGGDAPGGEDRTMSVSSSSKTFLGNVKTAVVAVNRYSTFMTVDVNVKDTDHNGYEVVLFPRSEEDVAVIMAAMAKAVREYFGDAEPEPDYEAIASEMATDLYMETVRGV
jgi:hypothetical protein